MLGLDASRCQTRRVEGRPRHDELVVAGDRRHRRHRGVLLARIALEFAATPGRTSYFPSSRSSNLRRIVCQRSLAVSRGGNFALLPDFALDEIAVFGCDFERIDRAHFRWHLVVFVSHLNHAFS